ncbi:MAG TPA: hypothetical protein VGJ95_07185 [Pseudonocardiaceae bacterium]
MNPFETFANGIAPEHGPALVAGVLAALWLGTARRWRSPTLVDRWAGVLLGVSAAVHLGLPLVPHHGPVLTAAFVVAGAGYAVLARRALHGASWRLATVVLVAATMVGYLGVVVGGEEPDQVGIATAFVELTALGLALVPTGAPGTRPARPRRLARIAAGATTVAATFLVGAVVWAASFAAHQAARAGTTAGTTADGHGHQHAHAGRAQAGMIMRPLGGEHHATDAQRLAADGLAAATAQAVARYADLGAALADGYRAGLGMHGHDVHLENKANASDGRTLDPTRPEMLVYAVDDGRATLLGVVYVMEVAGRPGPTPGGPITRWHAHNLCLSAAPPGLGIVSPYGGCPPLAVGVTSPEMMHVWVVDNPAGAFADGLDKDWVWAYHARHARPYHGHRSATDRPLISRCTRVAGVPAPRDAA